MRPSRLVPFLLLAAVCTAAGAAGGRRTDRVVAIVGAIIIPMDSERLLQSYTVIVRGGVIAGMGPASAVDVPAGAERIDGTGLYLLPGLTDAHVHVRDAIDSSRI